MGAEARQIVSGPQLRSTEPIAISLINDITQLESSLILVLDDYHVIESEKIHAGMGYLLEHQPPNFHILLVTRADPSISLARLRAHNQLIEIRAEELQFSLEEAATLLNEKMGLNLDSEQVAALNTHTESWVVGLQLAALSMKGKPSYETFINEFTGGHKFILDYLIEEVLVNLPGVQREFMLRTSILDRFCSGLCQAVTGDPSSQQMLDEIWKGNLFLIPLDKDGRWFRYHHLFAEVLQALLEQGHSDELTALHLKAAAWFESEGHPGEAVDHGLRSRNMQAATDLFLKYWTPFLHRGEVATVLRWLDALPEEAGKDNPLISLARCWALFLGWQNSAIERNLDQATAVYERLVGEGRLNRIQQDQIVAQLAMMRSVVARDRGDHAMSVAYVEEAARLIPEDMTEVVGTAWNMLAAARAGSGDFDGAIKAYARGISLSHAVGNLVGAYGCIYGQIMYMLIQGRLNEAEDFCRSSIEGAIREGHGEFPATGWLHIAMARIDLETGRLEEAEVSLRDGLRIALPGGFSEAVRAGRYLQVHLSALRGDLEAAEAILKDTAGIVNAIDQPYLTGELNWNWAIFSLNTGDLDTAHEKLQILNEKGGITKHANLLLWHRWLYPRLLCEEGHYEEALAALDEMINRARAVHSTGELIRMLAMQTLALEGIGDHEKAQDALREAVGLAAPEGYIWLWLNAGPGIEPLLLDLKDDGDISQSFYPYLDAVLKSSQTAFGRSAQLQPDMHTDLLTPRELEILHLISKGYSNPEIADELVVTINTIKKHTSNIYGKLGVGSRTQAIARAYELNLL
jgi:LuxR family maltose regulon positive regulatory protein